MKLGIMSDTHGEFERLEWALDVFSSRGAEAIVHCGDIDNFECLELLGDSVMEVYLTAGNMDRYIPGLDAFCDSMGINFGRHSVELKLPDGRYVTALHGHNEQLFSELIASDGFAYICYGHTHKKDDRKINRSRIINPGALVRATVLTVAVLDSDTDKLEYIQLPQ